MRAAPGASRRAPDEAVEAHGGLVAGRRATVCVRFRLGAATRWRPRLPGSRPSRASRGGRFGSLRGSCWSAHRCCRGNAAAIVLRPALNRAARLMGVAHGGQMSARRPLQTGREMRCSDGLVLVDLGEHRLRDLARPEWVFQVIAPRTAADVRAVAAGGRVPGQPAVAADVVRGPRRGLARVAEVLEELRVVTLTGVGGVGKTRLALEVAAEVLPAFPGWCVAVRAGGGAGSRGVADALFGVSSASTARRVRRSRRPSSSSCGPSSCSWCSTTASISCSRSATVVGASSGSCPRVRVLATSRGDSRRGRADPSGVVAGVPDRRRPGSDQARDAVRLFVDRAQAVEAEFAVDADNAEVVGAGLSTSRRHSVGDRARGGPDHDDDPDRVARASGSTLPVADRRRSGAVHVTRRFAPLSTGPTTCSTEPEQRLLARLSAFAGGCTRDAAEAVCCG